MRFTLVESIEEKKVYTIPEIDRWLLDRRAKRSNGRMQLVTLPVKTLVDDNNLLNDTSMACRRDFIWGEDPKNYHYKDYLANWTSTPITVKKVDGKYRITDGHHRVMALYNDGYEEAEVVLEESNKMNEDASAETDSEGNPLSPEQVEFFKDSKIRDKQGRLLVCYHGTESDFDSFEHSFIGDDNKSGYGFYFTLGTPLEQEHKHSKSVYLNITKPLNQSKIDEVTQYGWELRKRGLNQKDIISTISKKYGIDGIVDKNRGCVVAYFPNQIKSISNKTPTYSDNINEEN